MCNFKDSAAVWDDLRPRIMKLVQNCIVFKSGDDMVFTDYKPVSVLRVLSKILERLYNRLILYINHYGLLYEYQFGFQKGDSTHMALVTVIGKIYKALDQGELVIGIFLDFSKALDTVDFFKNWNYMVSKILLWNGLIFVCLIGCNM